MGTKIVGRVLGIGATSRKTFTRFVLGLAVAGLLLPAPAVAAPFNSGDIFAGVSGAVKHYDAAGTFIENLTTGGGSFNTGMAFDSSGSLYVTNFGASTVSKFDNLGVSQGTFGSGYSTPESIVFNNSGNAYVGTLGSGIRKFDSAGTFLGIVGPSSDWIDLAADQTTMFHTHEGSTIGRHNVATNTALTDFATALGGSAFALRILSDGRVLLANGGSVLLLSAAGAVIGTYDVTGEGTWFSLNLNPDGTSFWSGNYGSGKLYEFNIGSGGTNLDNQTQSIVTGVGGSSLFGVAVSGEHTAGCTDCGGGTTGVPEPATLILLGAGLLGLACRRHLRKP